jgi:hypothetical protein
VCESVCGSDVVACLILLSRDSGLRIIGKPCKLVSKACYYVIETEQITNNVITVRLLITVLL